MAQANTGAVVTDFDRKLAITTMAAGEALEVGDLVGCTEATPPLLYRADANVATAGRNRVLGVCTEAVAAGQYPTIVRSGFVRGLSSLNPGALVFLSETEGAIGQTVGDVDDNGDTQQVVGIAVSATAFLIDIWPPLAITTNGGTGTCVTGYASAA